ARAVLERTRFHLDQAIILAPMDGVIVEGDLRRRLGAPVRQGEVLFQQARLEDLYIQVEVPEQSVHAVLARTEARRLFDSQPDEVFALNIVRMQPAGMGTGSGTVFRMRAESVEQLPRWWRPGMSGNVRVDAGWRNA